MPAECGFAKPEDVKIVSGWARLGKASRELVVQDAAEFAGLACKRWRFYRKTGRYAQSLGALQGLIASQREAELALFMVAHADWHKPAPQLGVCLCRRTWSNGLCVDFLTVAPEDAGAARRNIAGVGRGLLYFVTEVAEAIRAKSIWGEATSLSAPAYRHMFEQSDIEDFFRLSPPTYRRFRAHTAERWRTWPLPA
jgi:hypothetical protein